jgi:hypothetical protein
MVMTLLFALVHSANRRDLLSSSYISLQSLLASVSFVYTTIDVLADCAPPSYIALPVAPLPCFFLEWS